jgi:NADPH:quinone reductase-like Zn-dependent oxidoreductase
MSARTAIEGFGKCAGVARALLALACAAPAAAAHQSEGSTMKAIVYREFGSPDVLRLEEVEKPVPGDDQVLVRVRAAALNPLDWHYLEGTPYIARPLAFGFFAPKETRLGVDYAGTIEAVGKSVTRFQPGDDVFGGGAGTLAEYVCVRAEGAVVEKPASLTFEQAAAVPIAALTALQSLRDRAQVRAGQKVLINGASGGVGTFAVQVAKSFGADVTGVCSTRNVELVLSLGADRVFDYTKEDFTRGDQRYDVILDNVGNRSLLACRRVLEPGGHYVLIGGGGVFEARWLGPLPKIVRLLVLSPFVSQDMRMFLANMNRDDLALLGDMMRTGKVTPVIDRRYGLSEVAEAFRYLEQGHARGKVIVTMDGAGGPAATGAESARAPESRLGSVTVALGLFGGLLGATLAPIAVALVLDRRRRRRHPGERPFRWGYYFSLQSFVMALIVGGLLGSTLGAAVLGLVYAALAWAFARRRRWAWILLTILSFNPLAWLVNAVYLRKRWSEGVAPATS